MRYFHGSSLLEVLFLVNGTCRLGSEAHLEPPRQQAPAGGRLNDQAEAEKVSTNDSPSWRGWVARIHMQPALSMARERAKQL